MAEATAVESTPTGECLGTGRRKSSVARVRVRPGSGMILVNKRPLDEFFANEKDIKDVLAPLEVTETRQAVDVIVKVHGGGFTGQAGAIRLGIARALKKMDPELEHTLREAGHLTRDSRMKERKKYGLRGARRGTQFSKR